MPDGATARFYIRRVHAISGAWRAYRFTLESPAAA